MREEGILCQRIAAAAVHQAAAERAVRDVPAARREMGSKKEPMNAASNVKKVIGIVSGKGGVGKSFVTASLACAMSKAGYKVGIMDADITGPSIPKMFGVHGQTYGTEDGMIPLETAGGIKLMSVNLLLEDEEAPVIWRGPVIAGVVKQFWNETVWGELDYLFVKMFGVHGQTYGTEDGMIPLETAGGIKLMSVNLLLEDEEAPVIWRGPVIAGVVKQFWNETVWGELDYLFVDMPPGTGDVPLTVFQSLPVDGIVVVTSPQELVQMIVKKAYNMAQMMHIPVLGLIENFSYLKCPDCGREIQLFGESHIEDVSKALDVPVFGRLPLDPAYAQKADAGEFESLENPHLETAVEKLKKLNA